MNQCFCVCSHLGDISSEVMCNMGISAIITQNEVILGSPGSYEWQGEIDPQLLIPVSQCLQIRPSNFVCLRFVGNVHVSWMNPDFDFDTQKSSFPNMQRRNIYTGELFMTDVSNHSPQPTRLFSYIFLFLMSYLYYLTKT